MIPWSSGEENSAAPIIARAGSDLIITGAIIIPRSFSIWMAGGGVKKGISYGETDEFGYNIIKDPVHIHDFHATLLHLMGIDHEQLIYKYQGRRFRLTDVAGNVVNDIIA
jgi:hypothetical protein